MSVDLNSCKKGDKLERRDGRFMTYLDKHDGGGHVLLYENGLCAVRTYTDEGVFGFDDGQVWDSDIISIIGQPRAKPRKVAKCYVEKYHGIIRVEVKLSGLICSGLYENYRNAIRGAHRFCAAIGHECVIVDETKGGDK